MWICFCPLHQKVCIVMLQNATPLEFSSCHSCFPSCIRIEYERPPVHHLDLWRNYRLQRSRISDGLSSSSRYQLRASLERSKRQIWKNCGTSAEEKKTMSILNSYTFDTFHCSSLIRKIGTSLIIAWWMIEDSLLYPLGHLSRYARILTFC